jgi:autotransporter-associated beta strand protein
MQILRVMVAGNVTLIADEGGVQGLGNITINGSGSILTIEQGGDSAFNGFISGTVGLTKKGLGTLTLDAGADFANAPCYRTDCAPNMDASSFEGDITIDQGRLIGVNQRNLNTQLAGQQTSSFGNPSVNKTITINNGGTLVFGNNDILGFAASTPNVTIIVNSGGELTNQQALSDQTGVFNALGNVVLNGGNISSIGGFNSQFRAFYLRGNVTATGNLTSYIKQQGNDSSSGVQIGSSSINVTTGSQLIISTALNDQPGATSSLTKSGGGNLVLTGANGFSGNLTITGGNVSLGDGGSTGSIPTSSDKVTTINAGSNLIFNLNSANIYSSQIAGAGSISQIGNGTTILNNSNTYTGITRITSGQIIATHANALGSTSSGTEIDGGGLVVTGSLVLAEPLSIKGSGVSGNGAIISASGSNTLSGVLTLQAASTINSDSGSSLNITGAMNGGSLLTANGSGNYTFGLIGNSTPVAGLNITNANNVIFSNAVNSSSDISVKTSGNININAPLVATNSMVKLNTTGVVTQNSSGSITASSLALLGVGGNYTLNSSANNVSTFAADTGTLTFKNSGALTIGTVNPTGITATGPILLLPQVVI